MREFRSDASAFLRSFLQADDGVITVEWVALAGALVIGAITIGWIMMNGLSTPATNVGTALSNCSSTSGGSSSNCTVP